MPLSIPRDLPLPASSPLLTDTLLVLLIQSGYFLLSRRFLQSALPTLRQISKAPDAGDGDALGLDAPDGGDSADQARGELGAGAAGRVFVNASGGTSAPASPHGRTFLALPGGAAGSRRSDLRLDSALNYDSDDSDSLSYTGSPAPGTPTEEHAVPLLPLYGHPGANGSAGQGPGHGRRPSQPGAVESELGKRLGEVASASGSASSSGGGGGKRRVLRVFNGREQRERERRRVDAHRGAGRVTTTRGLGWLATNLFSLLFSESLILLTLVMFHSAGILHAQSRRVHFSFSLHLLLLLILGVVPLVQCMQLTYRSRDPHSSPTHHRKSLSLSKRLLLSLVPFTLYIFLFTRIPPYITTVNPRAPAPAWNATLTYTKGLPHAVDLGDIADLDTSDESEGVQLPGEDAEGTFPTQEGWQKGGWLEPSLGRVLACGVVVLGGLSGLGAVRTAWNFVETGGMRGGRIITREDLINAERSLFRVRHELVAKREDLNARAADPAAAAGAAVSNRRHKGQDRRADRQAAQNYNPTWVGRVFGGAFAGTNETSSLRREVEGLEAIEAQIARSLEAMKLRKKRQNFARTFRGKIFNIVGYIFAAYCIARIVMCLSSIFFPPLATSRIVQINPATGEPIDRKGNTNGDWISFFIAWAIGRLPNGFVDVGRASRAISLLLTGLLILSSLAQVLRSVSRILRLTSKSVGAGFLLLGLGQLMATYAISLLIQLRSTLPPSMPDLDPTDYSSGLNSTVPFPGSVAPHAEQSLLATLPDFRIFGRLFDVMFLLAAFGTAIYRYAGQKMNGADEFGFVYH